MPDFSPLIAEAQRLRGVTATGRAAVKRAAGTLARRLPVEARRDIQDEYAVKAATVTRYLDAQNTGDSVVLTGRARAVGLIEFGGRWTSVKSPGATAQVFVAKGRHTYGGTFIAKGKNGNRQIFSRSIVGGKRAPRLPLHALYGPSVASMLRKGDRPTRLDDIAENILSSEIARLL